MSLSEYPQKESKGTEQGKCRYYFDNISTIGKTVCFTGKLCIVYGELFYNSASCRKLIAMQK